MRRATQVLAVLVAMALGHLITSQLDVGEAPAGAAPFHRSGSGDDVVRLAYADVRVDDLRSSQYLAPTISTDYIKGAGGVWIIVDLRLTASRAPVQWNGINLVDRGGRIYVPSLKSGCPPSVHTETGVPTYVMVCFDMPEDALEGLHVEVARGDLDVDGQRRDDVAVIDLDIDAERAKKLLAGDKVWQVHFEDTQPIEHDTVAVRE